MSLDVLKARVRAVVCRLAAWAKRTVTEALRPLPLVSGLVEDIFRSREELLAENLLLRQQLIVASRKVNQPRVSSSGEGQSWKTFLKNHTVWACDFVQLWDVWFRPVFAFFIVDVNAKHVVHVGVTRAPTEQWTAQQLREAAPFGKGPQVLIRDRDAKYGTLLDRAAEGADVDVVLTAPCASRTNTVVERFLGGVRRECLDHIIILGEVHLRSVLAAHQEGTRCLRSATARVSAGEVVERSRD